MALMRLVNFFLAIIAAGLIAWTGLNAEEPARAVYFLTAMLWLGVYIIHMDLQKLKDK